MTTVFFDCEVYLNYFYVLFKSDGGRKMEFRLHNNRRSGDIKTLTAILAKNKLVSFNGTAYDLPVIAGFLAGYDNKKLKRLSDTIIKSNAPWEITDKFPDLKWYAPNHIDLTGVTPLRQSLKAYGCRIHSPKLQDLPIEPSATISDTDAATLERYCRNDVEVTKQIYTHLYPQLMLRADIGRAYGTDMRSKSDVQIAEAILRDKLKEAGVNVRRRATKVEPFKYKIPDWVSFESEALSDVLNRVREAVFEVNNKGAVQLPEIIDQVIEFDGAKYKLGIGGLHSQEKKQVVVPNDDEYFGEYDVTSFYPSIIIGQKLYPEHLTEKFVEIYEGIFDERVKAKHAKDMVTANTYKIVLNGSYGKFGSPYSFLYSPELLIQTTLTGQLSLLMLIEWMSTIGVRVTSANTDGINILFYKAIYKKVNSVAKLWQEMTGYGLEWTKYLATYSESVNSYIALKPDGSAKTKGLYEDGSIAKGYSAQVCNDAIVNYLSKGSPIEPHIRNETDITKFLVMRGVTGGATWRDKKLGKIVRWYYATDGEEIRYVKNGNKVATSDGANPMMDLKPGLPDNLDYQWYIDNTHKKLKRLGL